ncbi:MAG: hypothetical protein HKM24_02715 [Gammaproteobacteria bacterium]|nr:hypothetical protein [Gammaproteobacteria bacterium]
MLLLPAYRVVERQINHQILLSDEALTHCQRLNGKRLHLHFTDLKLIVQVSALTDGIALTPETTDADATLTGVVKEFIRFVKVPDDAEIDLHIEGNARTVQGFQQLFGSIEFSVVEILTTQFGDVMGTALDEIWQSVSTGAQRAQASFRRNVDEYTFEVPAADENLNLNTVFARVQKATAELHDVFDRLKPSNSTKP